jgi:ketosteroid isomerase-like protein/mono/diheme cytochrome c family protein
MKQHIKHHSITVVAVLAVLAAAAGVFVYSGLYNIGADDPHSKPVFTVLQTLRDRSIHLRSEDLTVPNLEDPQLILKGAGQYAAMCTECHLKPGMQNSELRPGLYPQPPNLSQVRIHPKVAFWAIKHGIKMSAMPAWGASHDDPTIWSMVAFLQKLPGMTPQQYKDIVARAPPDEDMDMDMGGDEGGGHSHGGGDAEDGGHDHTDMDMGSPEMKAMAMPGDKAEGHEHAATAPVVALSLAGLKPRAVPDAEAAAQAFHAALQQGDRSAVLAALAPDATISEDGHAQSREAYAAGHLDEDIAFLKGATVTPISLGSMPMGNTAMVGSESTITTMIKDKQITLHSREMLTLKKDASAWRIVAIQWQSEPEAK